jgi:hypothetical protein
MRMPASFRLRIAGVDEAPAVRRGDISQTGLYVEYDRSVGPPGSVQWLEIGLPGDDRSIELMARVVRVATIDDLWKGRQIAGVAFEFMRAESSEMPPRDRRSQRPVASSEEPWEALVELIQAVARDRLRRESVALDEPLPARVTGAPDVSASVQNLSLRGMTLETAWQVDEGEQVRLEVPGPDGAQSARFVGRARRCRGKEGEGPPFLVDVEFEERLPDGTTAEGSSMADVVGALLEEVLAPRPATEAPARREHLFGDLERIPFTSLLTLFEMERLTGVLRVQRAPGPSAIYLRRGQVVDASGPEGEPRAVVSALARAPEGAFDFTVEDIDREDRLGLSTTALLLDLAREADERAQ